MGEIIDEIRSQQFRVFQLLSHSVKAVGKLEKIVSQIQMDADVKISAGQLVNRLDQLVDRL